MALRVPTSEDDAANLHLELGRKAEAAGVPVGLIDGLCLYTVEGVIPGSFLTAVLSNDLMEAYSRADLTSRAAMFNIVSFVFNDLPRGAWGSKQELLDWHAHHGLRGLGAPSEDRGEREKGDDDGVEYADPRDEREERLR